MRDSSKYDQITKIMKDKNIDIMALQETHLPFNTTFLKDGFRFIFSTSPSTKKHKQEKDESDTAGVGFVYRTELEPSRIHYKQINGRLIYIKLRLQGET